MHSSDADKMASKGLARMEPLVFRKPAGNKFMFGGIQMQTHSGRTETLDLHWFRLPFEFSLVLIIILLLRRITGCVLVSEYKERDFLLYFKEWSLHERQRA